MPSDRTHSANHAGISDLDLERIAAKGWQATEAQALGSWTLRAAGGFTGRANSVLPLGPTPDLADWPATVRSWYAARGLSALVQVPLPLAARTDETLAAAGWTAFDDVHVLIAPCARIAAAPNPGGYVHNHQDSGRVQHDSGPDPDWLAHYSYRGADLPPGALAVLTRRHPDVDLVFTSLRAEAGSVRAVARGALVDGWLGITAVTVPDPWRRRGLGSAVMTAVADWGLRAGAHSIYLQVAGDNYAALALYDRLGFTRHHRYRYRAAPSVDPGGSPAV